LVEREGEKTMASDPQSTKDKGKKFETLCAEYAALRSEIVERVKIHHQLLLLAFVAGGALISLSLHDGSTSKHLALFSPPIFAFVATAVRWNNFRIHQLGWYIRNHIEKQFHEVVSADVMRWDTGDWKQGILGVAAPQSWVIRLGTKIHLRLAFVGLQVLFVLAFLSVTPVSGITMFQYALLLVDVICVGYTLLLFRKMGHMG
jgi:hypothetical protein